MLATLTERRFSNPDWLFERKLDGERVLGFRHGSEVRLLSRNRKGLNQTYPEVVDALATQASDDFVIDGEMVALQNGQTSFARLQRRLGITNAEQARHSGVSVILYVFDLLHLDGHDTTGLALRDRKTLLRRALEFADPLRFTAHRNEHGDSYLAEACARGWEGVIAKRADGTYAAGRSGDWLKMKCSASQELVIGGFTEPAGSRIGLGALLVGYYDGGRLRYAGKVGTGFSHSMLVELRQKLERLSCDDRPFGIGERIAERAVHWVRPELVAQVAFTEWTSDGKLRHPRFEGLREDKGAADVVREQSGVTASGATAPGVTASGIEQVDPTGGTPHLRA
jgi:bifunctional non-homologous end joining protein LigD